MAEAKKHHHVPQFLLRRFADTGGRLLVVRTDADRQYVGPVRDVGHENQGHTLFWPDRAPDRTSLEARMAHLEGAASQVVDELLSTRTRVLSDEQRETLAFFVALQWSRRRFLLALVRRKVLDGEPPEEVAADRDSRRSIGLINILVSVLDPWAARRAGAFDPKEMYCSIVSMLWGWSWHVFRPRAGELIVGDNLVCMSGTAPGHEAAAPPVWARHGVGVGFGTCARITVPLAPELGLVLTPPSLPPARVSTARFNEATVFNSRAFVAHRPDWAPSYATRLAFDEAVGVQRWVLPMILEASTV